MKKLITVIGASGSGKTTTLKHILELFENRFSNLKYKFIREYTTRLPRPHEEEFSYLIFLDDDEFESKESMFIHINRLGDKYGISKNEVDNSLEHVDFIIMLIGEEITNKLMQAYISKIKFETIAIKVDKEINAKRIKEEGLPLHQEEKRLKRMWNKKIDFKKYRYTLNNNSTKKHLYNSIEQIISQIINKADNKVQNG